MEQGFPTTNEQILVFGLPEIKVCFTLLNWAMKKNPKPVNKYKDPYEWNNQDSMENKGNPLFRGFNKEIDPQFQLRTQRRKTQAFLQVVCRWVWPGDPGAKQFVISVGSMHATIARNYLNMPYINPIGSFLF